MSSEPVSLVSVPQQLRAVLLDAHQGEQSKAEAWLNAPHEDLDGSTPAEMLAQGDFNKFDALLRGGLNTPRS